MFSCLIYLFLVLDASSKFPYTGMLVKSPLDYGSYDECVELDLNGNITRVLGKYCFSSLIIPTTSLLDPNVVDVSSVASFINSFNNMDNRKRTNWRHVYLINVQLSIFWNWPT